MPKKKLGYVSPLELTLRKVLKDDYDRTKAVWTLSPYDWGPIKTSEGEIIKQGKDCTCMCLAKFGPKDYAYVLIFWEGCSKKPRVVRAAGFPLKATEHRSIKTFRHKVYRSRLELSDR